MIGPTPATVVTDFGTQLATTTFTPPEGRTGRDILLTHGLASNQQLWFGAAASLAERGHHVVTFDQRGHGQSSKPDSVGQTSSGYEMTTVADELIQLVEALGLDRPLIGGQSWGGNVVLEAARRHPSKISAAALIDGGFLHLQRQFPRWEDCADALAPPPLIGTPVEQITSWVDSMAAAWPAEGRAATLANFEVREDGTIAPWLTFDRHIAVLRGLWEHEPSAHYAEIDVPILILAASDSSETRARKQEAVDEAAATIPTCEAVWFEPAHHDVHAQFPVEVADALEKFLDDLVR